MPHHEWRPFPNGCIPGALESTCGGNGLWPPGREAIAELADIRTRSMVPSRKDAAPVGIPCVISSRIVAESQGTRNESALELQLESCSMWTQSAQAYRAFTGGMNVSKEQSAESQTRQDASPRLSTDASPRPNTSDSWLIPALRVVAGEIGLPLMAVVALISVGSLLGWNATPDVKLVSIGAGEQPGTKPSIQLGRQRSRRRNDGVDRIFHFEPRGLFLCRSSRSADDPVAVPHPPRGDRLQTSQRSQGRRG